MMIKENSVKAVLKDIPYETRISIGGHVVTADEPPDKGGRGKGPEAHDFICAALSSCTAITLKMYLDRKKWALGAIHVECDMSRETISGELKVIMTQIVGFDNEPDQDQLKRIKNVAQRCPVHKTLGPAMTIITEIR